MIGRGDFKATTMSSEISDTLEDALDVLTDSEEENCEISRVCLLSRIDKMCVNHLLITNADCPICRCKILLYTTSMYFFIFISYFPD